MKINVRSCTWALFALLAAAFLLQPFAANAQNCDNPSIPVSTTTITQDRDQMMCQLGVQFPPTPADCTQDPNHPTSRNAHPNSASSPCGNWTDDMGYTITRGGFGLWNNYDDYPNTYFPGGAQPWRVGVYTPIELLKMKDGTRVKTIQQWWTQRRPEIAHDLQDQLYGFRPDASVLPAVTWSVSATRTGTANGVAYKEKDITGTIDISRYPTVRNIPKISATVRVPDGPGPYPAIILIGNTIGQSCFVYNGQTYCFGSGYWPYVAGTNIGMVQFNQGSLQPDSGGANLSSYLIGLVNQGNWRGPSDWGALQAWGWGVSKLVDYFEFANTQGNALYDGWVDPTKLGVEGHSRYGKATLVAMAFEPRIAIGFPSDGGSLGNKMNRRHWGQNLENSSWDQEYHWMNGNWFNYMGPLVGTGTGLILSDGSGPGTFLPRKVENLTVDAHSLFALCAPRPVFINGGTNSSWQDPWGAYLSIVNASPVYTFLGKQGVIVPDPIPVVDQAYIAGDLGYRYHNGGHTDTLDYPAFIQFAQKYFNSATPSYDLTGKAAFFKSGYAVNPITHTFAGTVQITNNSALTLGPGLYFVVKGLPAGVTLANATGTTTADGYPAIAVPGSLPSGQTVTISVKFSSPSLASPTYAAALWSSL